MAIGTWFRRNPCEAAAGALYGAAVAQSRRPEFYTRCGVPDSVDGRFDMIAVHVFLLLHRLKQDHPAAAELAQGVFDAMFEDMDESLREMGAGDLGVGPRVKAMVRGLYGRVAAYDAGLAGEAGELEAALGRNLYGTTDPAPACTAAMAAYMRDQAAHLAGQDLARLMAGQVAFGEPPSPDKDETS